MTDPMVCGNCGAEILLSDDMARCVFCGQQLVLDCCRADEEPGLEIMGFFDPNEGLYHFPFIPGIQLGLKGIQLRLIGREACDILLNGKVVRSHVPPKVFGQWLKEHLTKRP